MANEKGEKLALHLDDLISDSDPVLIKDADLGVVNSSGHVQELERQFSRLSLISMSTVIDNAWVALAGSIVSIPIAQQSCSIPVNMSRRYDPTFPN